MTDAAPALADHDHMMSLVAQLSPETRARIAGRLDDRFHELTGTPRSPRRIQRRRVKGWRLPEGAVIVDRTSRFGNPFTVADAIEAEWSNPRRACVTNFEAWLCDEDPQGYYQDVYEVGGRTYDRRRILADLPLLRGKDVACPCSLPESGETDWCHARVLIELSNAPVGAL